MLIAGGAYYYLRQSQQVATESSGEAIDATNDAGTDSGGAWSALTALFTPSNGGSMQQVGENEDTNIVQDTVNSLKNIFTGNDIAELIEAGVGFLKVRRPDGSIVVLRGSRNWRNNNPGNIVAGDYATSMGAIGSDGRFAVFPNYSMGKRAKEKLIFEGSNYRNLPLSAAIARYAPPNENDTAWYQRIVLAAVNGANKVMSQFTSSERDRIMAAMEKVEGFKPGTATRVG